MTYSYTDPPNISVNYGRFLSSSEGIRFPESDVSWDVNLKQMQFPVLGFISPSDPITQQVLNSCPDAFSGMDPPTIVIFLAAAISDSIEIDGDTPPSISSA